MHAPPPLPYLPKLTLFGRRFIPVGSAPKNRLFVSSLHARLRNTNASKVGLFKYITFFVIHYKIWSIGLVAGLVHTMDSFSMTNFVK